MKNIYILLIALLFTSAVFAKDSQKEKKIKETFEKYKAAFKAENKPSTLFDTSANNNLGLKSVTVGNEIIPVAAKTHKLDSLLVERWNETTGKLEASQLEKWTWYKSGLGESWELYDLDSITKQWIFNDKEEYTWDDNGNKITHLDFNPNSTGTAWYENASENYYFNDLGQLTKELSKTKDSLTNEWENVSKITNSYDENGNMILSLTQKIDSLTNNWVNNIKEEEAYNENGENTYYGISAWDNTFNSWDTMFLFRYEWANGLLIRGETSFDSYFMHSKYEYSYDSERHKIQSISSEWDYTANQYIYTEKNTYTYDANGNQTSWMVYEWDQTANDWSENWKINYEFDSSGNCIYRDRYNIDDSTKAFVLNWKNDYTYDDNGNLTYKISNNWDGIDSSWIKNYEQNYSYDAYGNTIFKNKLVWDTITNDWIGDYEENYLYDASGNALLKNKLVWDTTTNKFLTEHQTDYAYDFETQFSEIIYPSEYEYWHISNLKYFDQYANTMLQKTYSEQKNNQLEPTEVFNFYYSEKNITSTNNFAQQKIKVYPNPATNFIQFDGIEKSKQALVELYNLNGEKILSKEINKGRKLAISHLTSGMYLFKLTQDSQINLGKIIKK